MSVQLVVNGTTYNYPSQGDAPAWGSQATAWAQGVTNVLNNVTGTGDITPSVATIANNQSSAANITGLIFSTSSIRSAIVEYSVYRVTTGGGATEKGECGTMYLTYLNNAMTWDIAVIGGAGSGVTFSITSLGQVQYVSTNFTGSAYSGTIKFRARALTQ